MILYSVAHFAGPRCWAYIDTTHRTTAIKIGVSLLRRYGGRVRISVVGQHIGCGYPMIWQRGRRGLFGPRRGRSSPE